MITHPDTGADTAETWIGVKEAARRLDVSADTVRRRCDDGTLRCLPRVATHRSPGRRRVLAGSVRDYARTRQRR